MIHADGFCERTLWDPEKCEEVKVNGPINSAGYGPRTTNRMRAEERYDELRKQRESLINKEQENLFKSLPETMRKTVMSRIAEWELQLHPEDAFSTPDLDKVNEEYFHLQDMIYGGMGRNHHESPEHPYPALMGIRYKRLCELELDCAVDKAVT